VRAPKRMWNNDVGMSTIGGDCASAFTVKVGPIRCAERSNLP
jgi:hypothetical protein